MNLPSEIQLAKLALKLQADYGAKAYPTEGHLQAASYQWWNIYFRTRSVMYAIPNGGTRHPAEVLGMKAQGLRPGVSDLHLLLPDGLIVLIEMKNGKKELDPEQKLFKKKVEALGFVYYKVCTCWEFVALMLLIFDVKAEDCNLPESLLSLTK